MAILKALKMGRLQHQIRTVNSSNSIILLYFLFSQKTTSGKALKNMKNKKKLLYHIANAQKSIHIGGGDIQR